MLPNYLPNGLAQFILPPVILECSSLLHIIKICFPYVIEHPRVSDLDIDGSIRRDLWKFSLF